MTERTFNECDKEFKNLRRAANIMTTMSDSEDIKYVVRDCYLDYGQDWMWTTIIKVDYKETGILRECQELNPRDWKLIVGAESKIELLEIMKNIIK